jgi:hypothetical protein
MWTRLYLTFHLFLYEDQVLIINIIKELKCTLASKEIVKMDKVIALLEAPKGKYFRSVQLPNRYNK